MALMQESTGNSASHPVLDADPFSREHLTDPYPLQEAMREAGPVVWLKPYGIWATARHEHVQAILNDHKTFCSSAGVGLSDFRKEKPWRPPSLLLEADPPAHDRPRRILTRILSPAAVRKLRAAFDKDAEELTDKLVGKGHFDAVKELAEVYPLHVLSDAVGIPRAERENIIRYAAIGFATFGPRNWIWDEVMPTFPKLHAWVMANCERDVLTPEGFGAQIYKAADDGEITMDEARLLVRTLLSAGVDTAVNGFGNMMLALARHPDQWAMLCEDPSLAKAAFEEALRFEPPIQMFFRTTTREAEIGGVKLGEGQKVMLSLGGANRDPRKWEEPSRFNIKRSSVGHVAFGTGIHGCLGQMFARLEGEALLTAFAKRAHSFELVGEPTPSLNNTSRGYASVPLKVNSKL
jgi:4-methoxybenzoate monooxygenase (O-demethylating)